MLCGTENMERRWDLWQTRGQHICRSGCFIKNLPTLFWINEIKLKTEEVSLF